MKIQRIILMSASRAIILVYRHFSFVIHRKYCKTRAFWTWNIHANIVQLVYAKTTLTYSVIIIIAVISNVIFFALHFVNKFIQWWFNRFEEEKKTFQQLSIIILNMCVHWKLQLKCLQIKSVPWNSVFSGHLDVRKKQHIFPINKQECGLFLFDSLLRKENEIYSNENKRIERVVNINFLFIIIGYLYIQMLEMKQHSQSQRDSIVILKWV